MNSLSHTKLVLKQDINTSFTVPTVIENFTQNSTQQTLHYIQNTFNFIFNFMNYFDETGKYCLKSLDIQVLYDIKEFVKIK